MAVQAVNLPLHDIRFADIMAERLGLPVVVDNDANCAVLAEARAGAGAGCVRGGRCSRSAPGSAAGWCCAARSTAAAIGGGRGDRATWSSTWTGRPCQGNCPNWGCLESVASGTALVREASLARRAEARHRARARAGGRAAS